MAQEFTASELSASDICPNFQAGWQQLSRDALVPNPFLEPAFVLTQMQHLHEGQGQSLWTVRNQAGRPVLLTAARPVAASSQILFPHLHDGTSTYKFLGGLLVDRRCPRAAILTFLEFLKTTRFRHGMVLNSVEIDSPLSAELYTSAALSGYQVQLQNPWSRASLNLLEIDRSRLFDFCLSKNRRKSLRRAHSKLQQRGTVQFRVVQSSHEADAAAHRFLDLERRGWKGASGTAMSCSPEHRNFFAELVNNLSATGKVLFGELMVGDKVVASTCNLLAGQTLFAFKIGWDPDFQAGSPGAWAELELANYISRERPDITTLNSCSTAGSYLERIWPHRMAMGNVILSQSHRAVLYSGLRKTLRTAKRLIWPVTGERVPPRSLSVSDLVNSHSLPPG